MSRLTKKEAHFCIMQIFGEGFYAATCKPWRKATIKYVAYHYPDQPLIAYFVSSGHDTWEEALDAARLRMRVKSEYNPIQQGEKVYVNNGNTVYLVVAVSGLLADLRSFSTGQPLSNVHVNHLRRKEN